MGHQLLFNAQDIVKMPIYKYEILNEKGEPTNQFIEVLQSIKDKPLVTDPETGNLLRKVICAPAIKDGKPAWERCSDVRDHIRNTRPKWIHDKDKGIRERFDPKKHG